MLDSARHDGRRGQILPLIGVGLIGAFGVGALAVAVGFWRYQQRLEQAAADSAAVAGAIRLNYPTAKATGTPVQVAPAANGYQDSGDHLWASRDQVADAAQLVADGNRQSVPLTRPK